VHSRSTPAPASFTHVAVRHALLGDAARLLRWWRAPLWVLALFTGAKSFCDNPVIGSQRLNRLGLHLWRVKAAHAVARWRRARLAHLVPPGLRGQFDRNGFAIVRDVLPPVDFARLQKAILDSEFECRAQCQGDTITRRIPVGPGLRRQIPALDALLRSKPWRGLMAYVATTRGEPLYYIQTVSGGAIEGPPDPQLELHSDTFHPSLKAWFFLTDVSERPLTYVAGSHRLNRARADWERRKSIDVAAAGDRLSQRGSLRVRPDELVELGLPAPTEFKVPANTLVVADTCGFHARAPASGPSVRVELWAYARRSPFLPWTGRLLTLAPAIAQRRMEALYRIVDLLDRKGLRKQHWRRYGRRRPLDP
jgi:hypothetical protein